MTNGHGGIDWAGLPYVVAHLGVTDVAALMNGLLIIKTHRQATPGDSFEEQ